ICWIGWPGPWLSNLALWRELAGVQIWMAVAGILVLLCPAISHLAFCLQAGNFALPTAYPPPHPWTLETGSLLGWVSLVLVAAAATVAGWRERVSVLPGILFAAGLGAVVLLACGVERAIPGWGYR